MMLQVGHSVLKVATSYSKQKLSKEKTQHKMVILSQLNCGGDSSLSGEQDR